MKNLIVAMGLAVSGVVCANVDWTALNASDWVSCMVYVALRLEFLADVLDDR